jgi:hypothetical protein
VDEAVKRWVAFGGLAFVVLLVVSGFITPNPPSTNATPAKVASFFHQHQGVFYVSAYLIVVAVVLGLVYFWYLREWLARVPGNRRLLTVAYAGVIVFAMSGVISAGLDITLADGGHAGNVSAATMQTLNLLRNDLTVPIVAAGATTFLLLTGVVVLRNGGLPRWLGWAALVLSVIAVTGIVGPLPVGLWVLMCSIRMLVRGRSETAGASAAPGVQSV